MPLTIDGSGDFYGVTIPDIEIIGSSQVNISDSSVGDILVTNGTVNLNNVTCGDVVVNASIGESISGSKITCASMTLNGGAGFQNANINGLQISSGALVVSGQFVDFSLTGVVLGKTSSSGPTHTISNLTGFTLQAISNRTAQEGFKFTSCVGGDVFLTILNPGGQTDNTYDGIDLVTCDRLNLYGSVRGALDISQNPRYALDIPTGNTLIDVWMALSGYQTGAINDGTAGQVTVH